MAVQQIFNKVQHHIVQHQGVYHFAYPQLCLQHSGDEHHGTHGKGAGADPEFLKWNGDKGAYAGATEPYSPDHNSWGIITAASNHVKTAAAMAPGNSAVSDAWNELMCGETSCYWYWDGTEEWDSKPATAANLAVEKVSAIVAAGTDQTGPSIYHPQREPYNPGAEEWEIVKPCDFTVWSYVYDLSGLSSVKLKYRVDKDGVNPLTSNQNETYAGGDEVGPWQEIDMTAKSIPSITNPQPAHKAEEYSAEVKGLKDVLVDYFIEATDTKGNVSRSMILHVYVGDGEGSTPIDPDQPEMLGSYTISPANPTVNDVITITAVNGTAGLILHWGVNDFAKPIEAYLPAGSQYYTDGKAARTPFTLNSEGKYEVTIGPFNNDAQKVSHIKFVTNNGSQWDNNGGKDYSFKIAPASGIDAVVADTDASVEYFTLQGVRVAIPEAGIYLCRKGDKVTKVIIR